MMMVDYYYYYYYVDFYSAASYLGTSWAVYRVYRFIN